MTPDNHDDRDLARLFEAARRSDARGTPDYASTTRPHAGLRRPRPWPRFVWIGAMAAGLALAAVAWVGVTRDAAPVRVAEATEGAEPAEPAPEQLADPVPDAGDLRTGPPPAPDPRSSAAAPGEAGTDAPRSATPAPPPVPVPSTSPEVALPEEFVERIAAVAKVDVVDPDAAMATTQFSADFVQELPVPGRFYQNVVSIAPGAEGESADGIVHGSRDRDFNALVAGQTAPNSIEEMEVITAGAQVEYSRAQGGAKAEPSAREVLDPATRQLLKSLGYAASPAGAEAEAETSGTERYAAIDENPFRAVAEHPFSTFSIDVDTASYANVRRFLDGGRLPPRDAVRIEELVNYFRYDDPAPRGTDPFSVSVELADCPWNPDHRLARIGLKAREGHRSANVGSNLVFLIDVSGSMQAPNKLPLLKEALGMLARQLGARDRVAIVVYAGSSGLVLPPTPGDAQGEILGALARLEAGGSTAGAAGLRLAYEVARDHFLQGGVNRVILATDGDFNVGVTNHSELLDIVAEDAKNGVFLTALGFGYGNYKDDTLEQLADRGNGNYAYIDSLDEARKVLVDEIGGTLVTVAKDVKIQVEFNPVEVGAYRLLGYENRMLAREDFNDDRKDAGEIGAGHSVTAFYELVPPGAPRSTPPVDAPRYQAPEGLTKAADSGEAFTVKLRYKEPEDATSRLIEIPVVDDGLALDAASADFRFASAVAGFGMLLRGSEHAGGFGWSDVERLALDGLGPDDRGLRKGFLDLVRRAATISASAAPPSELPTTD